MKIQAISGIGNREHHRVWRVVALIALQAGISCTGVTAEVQTICDPSASKGCITANEYFKKHAAAGSMNNSANAIEASDSQAQIGLALAGGGTRASQISIGILKGLHEAGVLEHVTHLSTVSGGGYAGYWYVSQRLNKAKDDQLFADCIPSKYAPIIKALGNNKHKTCTVKDAQNGSLCICPASPEHYSDAFPKNFTNVLSDGPYGKPGTTYSDPYSYQNSLRGHTDLFAPTFNYTDTRKDNRFVRSVVRPIASQLAMALTADILGDVVFDWNINTSPSRNLYREGIRRIYGLPPLNCAHYLSKQKSPLSLDKSKDCMNARPLVDEVKIDQSYLLPTFDDLRNVKSGSAGTIPKWIINATTPVLNCPHADGNGNEFCARTEFFSSNAYPAHKATFEFTPDYWGSGEFGYWPVSSSQNPFEDGNFDLINAVSSSAAFFDPNEKSLTMGGTFNVALQATGFKWGYYLRNPNVNQTQRLLHRGLFFPLYLGHRWRENKDAVDIHLIDGGQSENLGAYALIRRRIPNIIISDHATEAIPGNMEDICRLKKALQLPEFAANNGGKVWHIQLEQMQDLEAVCSDANLNMLPKKERKVFNIWNWKNPVVQGCAVEVEIDQVSGILATDTCESLRSKYAKGDASRHLKLFVIKPAIDLTKYESEPYEKLPKETSVDLASTAEIVGFIKNNLDVRNVSKGIVTKTTEGGLLFPSHSTVNLTIDSSPWLFGAYRELAAQAVRNLVMDGNTLKDKSETIKPQQAAVSVDHMQMESKRLTDNIHFNVRIDEVSGKALIHEHEDSADGNTQGP